ncbi:hypothetical protein ARSEF1564_009997 [Beauveria bassiana]
MAAQLERELTCTSGQVSCKFTCPICREEVKGSHRDTRAANLVDWFLGQYPQKAKSDELKREMDETYRPSDEVLPYIAPLAAGTLRLAEEEGQGGGRGSVSSSDTFAQEGILWHMRNRFYNLDEDDGSGEEQREIIDLVTAMSLSTYDQETNARRTETRSECETCDRTFLSKRAAKQHMNDKDHWADRFVCETCDRTFLSERAAEQHMNDKNHWTD